MKSLTESQIYTGSKFDGTFLLDEYLDTICDAVDPSPGPSCDKDFPGRIEGQMVANFMDGQWMK